MRKERILIKDGLLIDGVKKDPLERASVLIENGQIREIGKGLSANDAKEINAEGKTVMPGMIDSHVHICFDGEADWLALMIKEPLSMFVIKAVEHVAKYLPYGFTTIRDLGSPEYLGVSIRNAIDQGIIKGPRVLASGKILSITGGHGQFFPEWISVSQIMAELVDGKEDIRKAVRRQLMSGADVIKLCATGGELDPVSAPDAQEFSDDEIQTIVEEAHRLGRKTSAHALGIEGVKAAIRSGVDSIEHGFSLDDETVSLMKQKGTFLVPTFSSEYRILGKDATGFIPEWVVRKAKEAVAPQFESFKRALRAGVKIAMGTDAGTPFLKHGDNALELELMVKHGMSEMDAIIATTRMGAENLGISDKTGSIEKGKLADVIVVDGNPLDNISLLQNKSKIEIVIKQGEIVKDSKSM